MTSYSFNPFISNYYTWYVVAHDSTKQQYILVKVRQYKSMHVELYSSAVYRKVYVYVCTTHDVF